MDKNQKRYNNLLALNGEEMPSEVTAAGERWLREKTFKHDFFAATGLYTGENGGRAVLKIFRTHAWKGIPFQWISRWEARHESIIYDRLQDSDNVPAFLGRVGPTGIMHEFIAGEDLLEDVPIDETLFEQIESLLETMHERGIAYADTNKPDNILVGDDGKGYLIDFQISWIQPRFPLNLLTWPIFSILKDADFYHMRKHRRKFFPESLTAEELNELRPWYIRIHRAIATPIRGWRRKYLRKVEEAAEKKPEGTERH